MDVTVDTYMSSVLSISSWLMFIPILLGYFVGWWVRPKGAPKAKSVNIRKIVVILLASTSVWVSTGDVTTSIVYCTIFMLCSTVIGFMVSHKSILMCLSFTVVAVLISAIVLCCPNLVCGYLMIGILEGYVASIVDKALRKKSRSKSKSWR